MQKGECDNDGLDRIWFENPIKAPPKLNGGMVDDRPDFLRLAYASLKSILEYQKHSPLSQESNAAVSNSEEVSEGQVASVESVDKQKVSEGFWLPHERLVFVDSPLAKHFTSIGHFVRGKLFLLPEEALHLVDLGSLHLRRQNGDSMSLLETYQVCIQNELDLNQFIAVGHLRRLGYIVKRHQIGFRDLPPSSPDSDQLADNLNADVEAFEIDFDVWMPNHSFSKNNCGTPDYFLHVSRRDEFEVSLDVAFDEFHVSVDNLIVAIVQDGLVNFLSCSPSTSVDDVEYITRSRRKAKNTKRNKNIDKCETGTVDFRS